MRQLLVIAVALFLAAADKLPALRYSLSFGATPTSPIGPPVPCKNPSPGHELCPYLEPDYVADYESVVPQAIQSCGASFLGFQALTEGAQRAFFDVDPDRAGVVVECIKKHVPQAHVVAPGDPY